MDGTFDSAAHAEMNARFHRDALIALATVEGNQPHVRTVNSFYEEGAFYVITHARSGKMQQIAQNERVAISGEWFTAEGIGENLGHVLRRENREMAEKLRAAFSSWYGNGHIDESDSNTCILRVRLTRGVLMAHGTRYEMDFEALRRRAL